VQLIDNYLQFNVSLDNITSPVLMKKYTYFLKIIELKSIMLDFQDPVQIPYLQPERLIISK